MVVKIRLARFGRRHQPFYNIVVAKDRSARNSKPMEVLGTYDPTPRVPLAEAESSISDEEQGSSSNSTQKQKRYKDIRLDTPRIKYWLGVGAQPSDPVWRLLALMGLMEPKPGTTAGAKK